MIYDKTMPHPGRGAQTWGKAAQTGPGLNQPGDSRPYWGDSLFGSMGLDRPDMAGYATPGGRWRSGNYYQPGNAPGGNPGEAAPIPDFAGGAWGGTQNMLRNNPGFLGGMMGGKQPSPLNAAMVKQRTIGGGVKQPAMNQPTRTITTDPRNQPAPYGSGARLDRGAAPPRSYNRDRFEQAMQNYDDVVAAGPSHPLYRDLVVGGTHYWKDLGLSSAGGGPDGRGFYDKQAARQYALDKWGPSGFTGGAGQASGTSGAYGLLGALNQQRIR